MNAPTSLVAVTQEAATPAAPVVIGRLGPFDVAIDGTLAARDVADRPSFGFRWRGRRIAACLDEERRVVFSVLAAHVPFTAESAEARPRVIAAVAALRNALPRGWRLRLTPDHGVHLETAALLGSPPTARRLVAAATEFVLALDPCLDLLEEQGARGG